VIIQIILFVAAERAEKISRLLSDQIIVLFLNKSYPIPDEN